jgi:peptidoglycan/LPS O-acetylase OafA/YrhL
MTGAEKTLPGAEGWAGHDARDNNLNLIRALAATAVLVSHAWPISLGSTAVEPLTNLIGITLGTAAVYVFFAISGYLIMASFDRSRDWRKFLAARSLRLFPGLLVSLLLVAFVMGPAVSSLSVADYFADQNTYAFVARNMALLRPQFTLPGVFKTNPYPAVEGSIWTLVYEVACYMSVLVIGLLGAFGRWRLMAGFFLAYGLVFLAYATLGKGLHHDADAFHRLSLPFAIGALFFVSGGWLRFRLIGCLGLGALAAALSRTALAEPALVLALAYGTFWLAFVPRGPLLGYNRLGDYSYGIYIYAFPVQGLVVWFWGPQTPAFNILAALPLTLVLAILSWHLVEAPALSLRHRLGRARNARSDRVAGADSPPPADPIEVRQGPDPSRPV